MLKIDNNNEKAILRKCSILAELKNNKECEANLKKLESILHQSEKQHAINNEIKIIRSKLQGDKSCENGVSSANSEKLKNINFDRDNDWYF